MTFREMLTTRLERALDVGLGAPLWAIELELPKERRRPWKFTIGARVVGRLYAWGWKTLPTAPAEEREVLHACTPSCDHGDSPRRPRARCLTVVLREDGHDLGGRQPRSGPCDVYSFMGPVCGCGAADCVDLR